MNKMFLKCIVISLVFLPKYFLNAQSNPRQNNTARQGNTLQNTLNNAGSILNGSGQTLTNGEVVKGLREALNVGVDKCVAKASAVDGFFKNPNIKIPFPQDVIRVKNTLDKLGMKPQTEKFVETLNRAAELAAKDATPIFLDAILNLSITDGISILKGNDRAATDYLKTNTNQQLRIKFLPIVKQALQKVKISSYWNPLATRYNRLPGVSRVNPDLNDYVTTRAIEGLFKLIGEEEIKIRKDPGSRISDLLKKVFG